MRRYVRDAGDLLAELNVLTRCDCTTRNERKAAMLRRRMDELEAAHRRAGRGRRSWRRSGPSSTATQVMEQLGMPPGPLVGEALTFLLEIRLDEGLIGDDAIQVAGSRPGTTALSSRRPNERPSRNGPASDH